MLHTNAHYHQNAFRFCTHSERVVLLSSSILLCHLNWANMVCMNIASSISIIIIMGLFFMSNLTTIFFSPLLFISTASNKLLNMIIVFVCVSFRFGLFLECACACVCVSVFLLSVYGIRFSNNKWCHLMRLIENPWYRFSVVAYSGRDRERVTRVLYVSNKTRTTHIHTFWSHLRLVHALLQFLCFLSLSFCAIVGTDDGGWYRMCVCVVCLVEQYVHISNIIGIQRVLCDHMRRW